MKLTPTQLLALSLPLHCNAWTAPQSLKPFITTRRIENIKLSQSSVPSPPGGADLEEDENPCWQDIWNYDCAMSTIYSASFVARDWIKSMPCAAGLAVSVQHDNSFFWITELWPR